MLCRYNGKPWYYCRRQIFRCHPCKCWLIHRWDSETAIVLLVLMFSLWWVINGKLSIHRSAGSGSGFQRLERPSVHHTQRTKNSPYMDGSGLFRKITGPKKHTCHVAVRFWLISVSGIRIDQFHWSPCCGASRFLCIYLCDFSFLHFIYELLATQRIPDL